MKLRPHHFVLAAPLAALALRGLALEAFGLSVILVLAATLNEGRRTIGHGSWRDYFANTCM